MVAHVSTSLTDTPRLLTQLSRGLVGELRAYLANHRARLEQSLATKDQGFDTARAYAKLYDGVLSSLFGACHAAMPNGRERNPMSLAAVGSYGRNTLSPHSDLDVRLVCGADPAVAAPMAEALLYPLWDAGVSIGHQVVTRDDLMELAFEDVTTATTLLDLRTITGDAALGQELLERAYETVFSPAHLTRFVDDLQAGAVARHQRFGDSVYLLEPDLKNGAGGLRDLDTAHWCARARFRVSDLSELVGLGILLPREWAQVAAARNFLMNLRHALHLCVGRRTDRLTFDLQERVTERLARGEGMAATEQLMSDYYRGARVITRLVDTVLSHARPSVKRRSRTQGIGGGLLLRGGAVAIERPELLGDDPALALRVYDEAVQRHLPLAEETRQRLVHAASSNDFGARLRSSPAARELFSKLLCVVRETRLRGGSVLADLHDVGLLVAMIPEFATLVGRVHRDTYHVYTVDVHSVAAVDHLRALCRGELGAEHPLASRLAADLPRRPVLFLAVLLHDIGKAHGGAGHTERGVEMACAILERLDIPEADLVEVQHLIRHHLSMYEVATRRDLDEPATLSEFCAAVKQQETLRELYLLTIADVTTTNPSSMTNWKRRMLDALYVAAERQLGGAHPEASPRTATVRASVLGLWPEPSAQDFIEHFVSGLPERYFYANEPATIVEHALFAASAQDRAASIRQGSASHPYFELWVVADDRPGLLAIITALLSQSKLKVRSAQLYSWRDRGGRRRCLDTFWVRGPEDPERVSRILTKLEQDLQQLLAAAIDPAVLRRRALSGARPPRLLGARFATEVNVDNKSASNYTIIEVITADRPALLFCLSNALQEVGLSIWFAKINTEGERAIDVFYVLCGSQKLVDPSRIARLRQAIASAVQALESHFQEPATVGSRTS